MWLYAFIPVIVASLGAAWTSWREPSPKLVGAVQHLAAGVVFYAAAGEILPDAIHQGTVWTLILGGAVGIAALLLLRHFTDYHMEVHHVLPPALIPVTYAAAMAAAALAALGSGCLYERVGLRGLVSALPLAAAIPALSFSINPTLIWIGALVWGAAVGLHESTMRAAVADLVPATRRGTGYGTFTAAYGLAWLAGSTAIGALYTQSEMAVTLFVIATQIAALILFLPLAFWPATKP